MEANILDTVVRNQGVLSLCHHTAFGAGPLEAMDIMLDYPAGFKLVFVMLGLCLPVFCVVLDNKIIATTGPSIKDDFYALQDVSWYSSAYLLTICAFQLKLFSRFSIKLVFLSALVIFEADSLIGM